MFEFCSLFEYGFTPMVALFSTQVDECSFMIVKRDDSRLQLSVSEWDRLSVGPLFSATMLFGRFHLSPSVISDFPVNDYFFSPL